MTRPPVLAVLFFPVWLCFFNIGLFLFVGVCFAFPCFSLFLCGCFFLNVFPVFLVFVLPVLAFPLLLLLPCDVSWFLAFPAVLTHVLLFLAFLLFFFPEPCFLSFCGLLFRCFHCNIKVVVFQRLDFWLSILHYFTYSCCWFVGFLFHLKGQPKCIIWTNSFVVLYSLLKYDTLISCLFVLRPEFVFLFLPCGPLGLYFLHTGPRCPEIIMVMDNCLLDSYLFYKQLAFHFHLGNDCKKEQTNPQPLMYVHIRASDVFQSQPGDARGSMAPARIDGVHCTPMMISGSIPIDLQPNHHCPLLL